MDTRVHGTSLTWHDMFPPWASSKSRKVKTELRGSAMRNEIFRKIAVLLFIFLTVLILAPLNFCYFGPPPRAALCTCVGPNLYLCVSVCAQPYILYDRGTLSFSGWQIETEKHYREPWTSIFCSVCAWGCKSPQLFSTRPRIHAWFS